MYHENFLVEHMCKREPTESFSKELNHQSTVLGFDLQMLPLSGHIYDTFTPSQAMCFRVLSQASI